MGYHLKSIKMVTTNKQTNKQTKNLNVTSVGENVEKLLTLYTVTRNIKLSICHGKQYGGSSKT